jgi:hypothetical protein
MIQKGQIIRFYIFYWPNSDLKLCYFDRVPDEIEFDAVRWMDWDELLQNVAPFKLQMYMKLRELAEPIIRDYLYFVNLGKQSPQSASNQNHTLQRQNPETNFQ